MTARKLSGFTLVEVAVAVAILGIALTTLIGLHTRLLNTYVMERSRIRAAFYAQYLMTMIELEADPPESGTEQRELVQALEDAGYFDEERDRNARKAVDGWRFSQSVTSVDLPLLADALRRVEIEISWGDTTDDRYSLVYLVPNVNLSAQTLPASPYPAAGGG